MRGRDGYARLFLLLGYALLLALATPASHAAVQVVYDNALQNGWQDFGWATRDLDQTAVVHSPPNAISWEPDDVAGDWQGLFFHHAAQSFADFASLRFWHRGNGGNQAVRLVIYVDFGEIGALDLSPLPAGWTQVEVTWAQLGIDTGAHPNFDGLVFQTNASANQATAYLDDIELVEVDQPPPGPVTVAIDPELDQRAIDPRIYGVNWAGPAQLATGLYTVNRRGGNGTTRYNWTLDTSNRAFDYYFLNIQEGGGNGAALDAFVNPTLAAGADVVMTVPIDQVAASTARTPGFSTTKYGPQTDTECTANPFPGCANNGNGICDPAVNTTDCDPGPGFVPCCNPAGAPVPDFPALRYITGNDPADTSIPVDVITHVGDLVAHVGTGVRYYNLDNEPMLWDSSHRDARGTPATLLPATPATYDEVWTKGLAAATEIKRRDPNAEVMGPDTWGWCDFFTSAADAAAGNCFDGPDRAAHGGLQWPAWYLQQSCGNPLPAGHPAAGALPVDWLDIHFYPQGQGAGGDGVAGTGGDQGIESAEATIALRLRSPRELYDPTWVSESWVGQQTENVIELIPRMRALRDTHCPQAKLALAEYKWGRDDTLSGALAQAEALAIFGREGLDMALRWVAPALGSLTEDAFRLYRNYDGAGAQVSGESVRAISSAVDEVGGYAVGAANGTLFVLLFNKDPDPAGRDVTVTVAGGVAGNVDLWRLDGAGLASAGFIASTPGGFSATLPARTATLARVALAGGGAHIFSDGFETGTSGAWSATVP